MLNNKSRNLWELLQTEIEVEASMFNAYKSHDILKKKPFCHEKWLISTQENISPKEKTRFKEKALIKTHITLRKGPADRDTKETHQ